MNNKQSFAQEEGVRTDPLLLVLSHLRSPGSASEFIANFWGDPLWEQAGRARSKSTCYNRATNTTQMEDLGVDQA